MTNVSANAIDPGLARRWNERITRSKGFIPSEPQSSKSCVNFLHPPFPISQHDECYDEPANERKTTLMICCVAGIPWQLIYCPWFLMPSMSGSSLTCM